MIEDLGLAEPHMNEAVPNMGVDQVWNDFGFDGTGSVVAVLDTGVRGDHEGLNDMDDEPFTTGCEQPDPDPLDPNPIFVYCDPKIVAFYDAVLMDAEQDPSTSYDSGTHGSHEQAAVERESAPRRWTQTNHPTRFDWHQCRPCHQKIG